MVVGWYHSHPGFGCWLSGVDINTQQVIILPHSIVMWLKLSLINSHMLHLRKWLSPLNWCAIFIFCFLKYVNIPYNLFGLVIA